MEEQIKCGTYAQCSIIQPLNNMPIMKFVGKWMELEKLLSEVFQIKKDKYYIYLLIYLILIVKSIIVKLQSIEPEMLAIE